MGLHFLLEFQFETFFSPLAEIQEHSVPYRGYIITGSIASFFDKQMNIQTNQTQRDCGEMAYFIVWYKDVTLQQVVP